MDELPAHAKAVLRKAHEHDQCHDEQARRRVRQGVARAVGVNAVGASVFDRARVAAPPVASKSAPLVGLLGKLTVTAVVVALVGSGIALRRRDAQTPDGGDTRSTSVVSVPPATGSAPLSVTAALAARDAELRPMAPQAPPGGPHVSAPQHAVRRSHAAAAGPRARARETLDAEVVLLRQLEAAVSRRDTHEAQRILARHRARFSQPVLREERQGFAALVGCMQQSTGALAASRVFVARYPNSVLTERVLRECEPKVP